MQGFPKYLNSRFDYEFVREQFPERWRAVWQELLDTRFAWFPVKQLADEEGTIDDTHRVVEMRDENDVITNRIQEEYLLDTTCKLLRIGFTVEEVQAALAVEVPDLPTPEPPGV